MKLIREPCDRGLVDGVNVDDDGVVRVNEDVVDVMVGSVGGVDEGEVVKGEGEGEGRKEEGDEEVEGTEVFDSDGEDGEDGEGGGCDEVGVSVDKDGDDDDVCIELFLEVGGEDS
mmetsp:Transcript_36236/g.49756  ORF Transcript_36236/g.49756 Transcript_36236/m.49756 type:complete len:115 (-) Transcript_36236:517-861(-)